MAAAILNFVIGLFALSAVIPPAIMMVRGAVFIEALVFCFMSIFLVFMSMLVGVSLYEYKGGIIVAFLLSLTPYILAFTMPTSDRNAQHSSPSSKTKFKSFNNICEQCGSKTFINYGSAVKPLCKNCSE